MPPYDVVGSSHNGSSISAHYFVNGQATPGQPANGSNKFLALGYLLVVVAACSNVHAPVDAGKAKQKSSAKGAADAGASSKSRSDAGTNVTSACQGSCAAKDASGTAGSGIERGDAGTRGASDAGHGTNGNGDAALAADACVAQGKPPTGTLLIVFDRSLSMNDTWDGMPKWQAAGSALLSALMPVQDLLTIGAVLFPSPNVSKDAGTCVDPTGITCMILGGDPTLMCGVNPITAPDQVSFKAGADAITELRTGANGNPKYQPVGATPTSEAVAQADTALAMATLAGNTVVVLITDGEPNCMWDQGKTTATLMGWLTQKKIKTYVVGLPGTGANAPTVLSALAQAGGTMQYLAPASPSELTMQLEDILQREIQFGPGTVDCTVCSPACGGDARCIGGICKCPDFADVSCSGVCTKTASDDRNCGACGHACASGETCCASSCVNTRTDKTNCGACGSACGSQADACGDGACTCHGGSACTGSMTCSASASGTGGTGGNWPC